ncbi:AP endonuclease 1 [Trinorchestia longiramus]|nr:AP endonuclease 1 [Trinorchestia longiramus]
MAKRGIKASASGTAASQPESKRRKTSARNNETTTPPASTESFDSDATNSLGQKWNFKIVSWNVNGIRAWLEKDGLSIVTKEDPDVLCLQETKCSQGKIPDAAKIPGYKSYFSSAEKEGYAGVATYCKVEPLSVTYGIGDEESDKEGRSITMEFENFYLVSTYVPNAGRGLVTLDKRMQWDPILLKHLKALDEKKPVIMCGDLNVAYQEIDLTNPKINRKNAGFTKEERDSFSTLLSAGFVDSFRHFYPDKTGAYTFWTYMMHCRAKNIGWRLDYFIVSERFKEQLCDSLIRSSVMGSDHCPITLLLHTTVTE